MTPTPLRPRILIADDEALIADTLALIFGHNGLEARAVYGGRQAVDLARSWRPDWFLGDVMMPGTSGLQAAALIREICPNCGILLFSGQAVVPKLSRQARRHNFEILRKPVHPTLLLSRLRIRRDS